MSEFKRFFPNYLCVNHGAYLLTVRGALEQLRLYDLEFHHLSYVEQTYPLPGYLAIFKLAENVGSLVGGRDQKLAIGTTKWMPEGFTIQESDGGIAMAVMMQILQWGKEKDLLYAILSANCWHDIDGWKRPIEYAMTVALALTQDSQALVLQRTRKKARVLYHSNLSSNTGGKVTTHSVQDSVGYMGRHKDWADDE